MMSGMARTCVFCGASGLTREHVIPRWLTAVLPEQAQWRGQDQATLYTDRAIPDGEPLHREVAERFNAMTVKAVCAQCNNDFMNEIEKAARPILATMIRGQLAIALDPSSLTKVATWAVKTGLMIQLTGQEPARLDRLYEHLFREGIPSDACRIWLGQIDDEDWALRAEYPSMLVQSEGEVLDASDPPNVLTVTLGLGRLLFHMFLPADPARSYWFDLHTTFAGMIPVWPKPASVNWPPSRATRGDEAWALTMILPMYHG